MENAHLIEYGTAEKDWWQFTEEEMRAIGERVSKRVRERAWAVGSPVYYMIGHLIIAEYPGGKKMIVEKRDGVETERPYNG